MYPYFDNRNIRKDLHEKEDCQEKERFLEEEHMERDHSLNRAQLENVLVHQYKIPYEKEYSTMMEMVLDWNASLQAQ
eukprot:PDM71006.1 hypothetical protein PRIPAC_44402 [Pristionchus pacificus]